MKEKLLLLTGIVAGGICFGQTTSPEITTSSGDHFTGSNAQLSWTIGEPLSETYSSGNNQLTQGFHQTKLSVVGIDENQTKYKINVFPNPTSDLINIDVTSNDEYLQVQLFDINGKVLFSKSFKENAALKMSAFSAGTYFLKISHDNQLINSFNIQKTN